MSENSPVIGVIMATWNSGEWVRASISSVLGQTYPNIVLAIVDDGSTDDTVGAIEKTFELVRDPRAALLRIEHGGVAVAKQAALQMLLADSRVTHVTLMDSDDICELRRFEKQLRHLDETGVDISFTIYGWMDESTRYLRTMAPRRANATAFCRREWYEKIGGWDQEGPEWGSDTRTIDKMIAAGATYDVLQDECYLQRRWPGQTTMRRKRG